MNNLICNLVSIGAKEHKTASLCFHSLLLQLLAELQFFIYFDVMLFADLCGLQCDHFVAIKHT